MEQTGGTGRGGALGVNGPLVSAPATDECGAMVKWYQAEAHRSTLLVPLCPSPISHAFRRAPEVFIWGGGLTLILYTIYI